MIYLYKLNILTIKINFKRRVILNNYLVYKKKMPGTKRANIKPGIKVMVVQKQDQRSGKLTEGVVQRLLTNSQIHPRGIKVKLESGIVGRVQEIL